ncbi:MAG: arsenosugar biosynthesis radical SAM protein ArsS [Myxococcales bacterium]|nr:arsenosugar biosynthesis radical SAM protein ArsS [Myxococcales bacterium]
MRDASPLPAPDFDARLREIEPRGLRRSPPTTLQVNVGRRCDLACHHCHVEAGPKRSEVMGERVVERILQLLERSPGITTLDLTGGAPELCPGFRTLVRGARALGRQVVDRCNLTVFYQPGQQDTPDFLAVQRVKVVASLPCHSQQNVDQQRGHGVYTRSIEALQWLNALGYAQPGIGLELDLVYNPLGASLPPDQAQLQAEYREALFREHGIRFDQLRTLTNMPIKRFAHSLARDGELESYMGLLVNHFNPATLPGLMCRELVSVSWQGDLYDCDFNQMLEIPLGFRPRNLWDIEDLSSLAPASIATGGHCFGCTAGAGSSCGGALTR